MKCKKFLLLLRQTLSFVYPLLFSPYSSIFSKLSYLIAEESKHVSPQSSKARMHLGPAASPWISEAPAQMASTASVGLASVFQSLYQGRGAPGWTQHSGVSHRSQAAEQDPFPDLLAAPVQTWADGGGRAALLHGSSQPGVLKGGVAGMLPASWPQPVLLSHFVRLKGWAYTFALDDFHGVPVHLLPQPL